MGNWGTWGNRVQGVWGTGGIGHMGNGAQGVWGTWGVGHMVTYPLTPPWSLGHRGMGHTRSHVLLDP